MTNERLSHRWRCMRPSQAVERFDGRRCMIDVPQNVGYVIYLLHPVPLVPPGTTLMIVRIGN